MNKIYKVIWNKAKNCYVVVSEIAKAHSKGGSTVRRVPHVGTILTTMLLASILSFGYVALVWADATITGVASGEGLTLTTLAKIQAGEGIAVTQEDGIITVSAEEDDTLKFLKKYMKFNATYPDSNPESSDPIPVVDARSNSSFALGQGAQISVISGDDKRSKDNLAIGSNTEIYADETGMNTVIGANAVAGARTDSEGNGIYTSYSTAIGSKSRVYGSHSISIGEEAQVGRKTKIGENSDFIPIYAYVDDSIAIGFNAKSYSDQSIAIGKASQAGKTGGTSYTDRNNAEPKTTAEATAIGFNAHAEANLSTALGAETNALDKSSTAVGAKAQAKSTNSTAIGTSSNATNSNSTAIGASSNASGSSGTAIGINTKASNTNSTAVGSGARAYGAQSSAIGASTVAVGKQNVAVGTGSEAKKNETMALGFHAAAVHAESIAVGHDSVTFGDGSVAIGHLTVTGMPVKEGYHEASDTKYISLPTNSKISNDSKLYIQTSDGTVLLYESSVDASGKEKGTYYKVKAVPVVDGNSTSWKFVKVDKNGNETTNNAVQYLAQESKAKDIRDPQFASDAVNHIDYFYAIDENRKKIPGTETNPLDGGIAIGSYTAAQGEKSLAVGLTSAAYGKNSIAQGLYASSYGEGAIAFGHETTSGAHAKIVPNANIPDAHTTEFSVSSTGITERTLVDGSVVGVDKNSEYTIKDTSGTNITVNSNGKITAIGGSNVDFSGASITLQNGTPVARDTATGHYYYTDAGSQKVVGDSEKLTFSKGSQSVTVTAGQMTLSQGGISFGSYSHAEGDRSMAIGRVSGSYDKNSTAVGLYANAYGEGSMAIGHNATTGAKVTVETLDNDYHTVALQLDENGNGKRSYLKEVNPETGAITETPTQGGIAIGSYAHASGDRAIAFGRAAGAYDRNSTAFGIYANALGDGSMAMGHGASTGVKARVVEGGADDFWTTSFTDENGDPLKYEDGTSVLDANGNPVSNGNDGGIAIGSYSHTEGARALAVGRVASAYGTNSTAIGLRSNAYGEGSIAFGHGVVAGNEKDPYAKQIDALHNDPYVDYDLDGVQKTYTDSEGNVHTIEINPNNVVGAIAFGSYAKATARGSLSVGRYSEANSPFSTAMGIRAKVGTNAENGIAIGREAKVVTPYQKDNNGNVVTDADGNPVGAPYGGGNSIAVGALTTVTGQNSIAIGTTIFDGTDATTGESILLGPDDRKPTTVTGDFSLAIGRNDTVAGDSSIAIGDKSAVTGNKSIAIGTENTVKGDGSGAIGDPNVVVGDSSYILGNSSEIGSVGTAATATAPATADIAVKNAFIIGNTSKITNEEAEGGLIYGSNAEVTKKNGLALGNNTSVSVADGVALGSDSVADTDKGVAGYDPVTGAASTKTTDPTWQSTAAAVSVGGGTVDGKTVTRQITNVAAGTNNTDAVNVAQLKAARVELKDGTNTTVTSTTDSTDGHTIYKVNVDNPVHFYSVNSIDSTKGNYDNKGATGTNALAAGVDAKAAGQNAVAIGNGATAGTLTVGFDSVAIGTGAKTTKNKAIAIGTGAVAEGEGAIVLGSGNASATGNGAMTWGSGTKASGTLSTAFGNGAIASGIRATAWGGPISSTGGQKYTTASGSDATAWGTGTTASGITSTTWGSNTEASATHSTAWGTSTKASGYGATAFGNSTTAEANNATSFGMQTHALGRQSTAFGQFTEAKNFAATAFGYGDTENAMIRADGVGATAFGVATTRDTVAQGTGATAFGYETQATAQMATAFGQRTQATGAQATAFGAGSIASGRNSTAFGASSVAGNTNATAFGTQSKAFGENSLAALGGTTGEGTITTDASTHASTVSVSKDAIGALAIGKGAHAQESYTYAIGQNAVTSAADTVAFGNNASATVAGGVALGSNSIADTDKEVAGYDPVTKAASTKTDEIWKSTAAAVSVGGGTITSTDDEGNTTTTTITRQITNVAAGTNNTDAVNVAQLKAARVELQDGTNTTVTSTTDSTDGHTIYKVNVDNPVHFYSVNSTDSTKGNYDNKGAKGADALAAGVDAKAAGDNAIAIGTESRAKGDGSIAIGNGAKAKEIDAIAIGTGATAKGVGSIALGRNGATAVGRDAMAWGVNTKAKGDESTAWGTKTKAKGDGSTAFGFETVAKGEYSTAWGEQTKAVGESATAWGLNTVAKGDDATAWGNETKAVGVDSTAWGIQTRAKGLASTAFGYYTKAKGDMSVAWGSGSQAIVASTAYGRNSLAALGGTTGSEADEVTAVSSVAIGKNAVAAKDHTYAIGQDALAQDENTIAMGNSVVAAGKNAVAIGSGEITRQIGTLIETDRPGEPTEYSFTDGNGTAREIQEDEAGIYYENDEGTKIYLNKNEIVKRTDNSDDYDAEDLITTTTYLITEAKNPAQASGENAIALGTSANASGDNSIAVGTRSAASSENTIAFGNNASATVADGVALGSNSVADTDKGVAGYDPVTGVASTKTTDPTWQSTAAAVSVGGGTVDGKTVTRQITDVAAGTSDTDAVNVAQLKKVAELADGALKFGGDNTTPDTYIERKSGQALDIKGGANTEPANLTDGNIAVVSNGRDTLNVKLAKDVDLTESGSLAIGKTKIEDAGITIQPASGSVLTKFTNAGISAGDQQINNVAAGTLDTDAVNVSQLTKAAAAAKTKVVKGTNIASVDPTTGADGQTIYMVNADGASVSKGSDAVTVTAGAKDTETNITDYAIDLSDATKATLNKVETRGLTFKGDSGSSEEIKLGDTLNVTGGATGTLTEGNIGVEADGKDLKVKLADNINLTKAGSVTIGTAAEGATVISQKGIRIIPATGDAITEFTTENISAGGQQIHKVKAGTADDDAVNVSQLKAAKEEAIGSVKLKFRGETGDEVVRGNNETLQVVGDGSNITTKSEDNKIKVELAKDLKVDSVTAGNTVINNEGVKADKVTVGDTVIEDGKVSVGDTTIEENKITMVDTTITNNSVTTKSVTADEVTAGDTTINNDGVTTNKVTVGDTTINNDGLTIDGGPSVTKDGIDAGNKKITGVAAGVAGTDAVNVDQLKEATSGLRTEVAGGTNIASVEHTTGEKGQSIYTVNAEGASVSAADGGAVTVTGAKDTATNITNYKVDLSDTAKASLDKVDNDGLTFAGDTGTSDKIKLGDTLNIKGGASGALSDGNIGVEGSGDTLNIKLAKDIKDVDTLQVNKSVKVGNTTIEDNKMTMGDTVITNSGVTANRFTAGNTTVSNDGVTIANGPSVTKKGVDAGGQKVTNVAPGEADTDAANMGQLRELADNAGNAINNVSNEVNRLDGRMKKGLAGAAALAALHPMDFDPDDKLTFAAGMGNYRGQNAAAIGAFYRPDEKIMFSVGGTVGNGENMVNAGVSFALDRVNRVTTSRTAMAHEIVELKKHIAHQDSQIAQLTQLVNKLVGPEQQIQNTSMFPDVPENHWAYAYLEDLQKRGIVEGYPDGQFRGDRSMTRYEFAALLDRALRKGEELDARIAKEFEPELGRIYVERIKGQDNDRHKIERVRVNNTDTRTRDVYGTKIS